MTTKSLLAGCGLLLSLTACGHTIQSQGFDYGVGAALTMPPFNTVLFGPCEEEFGMPDSRRANCEWHYKLFGFGKEAPWVERQKYYAATAYQPGELSCTRTRGELVDCSVVSGEPHRPPYVAAPNNLRSE
jgi:hypothetical protein